MKRLVNLVLIAAVVTLMMTACRVHYTHNLERARVEIPEEYSAEPDGVTYDTAWWTEFNDPVLDEVVEYALNYNLDLRQAWSRLSQAWAQSRIVCAEKIPVVGLNIRASHFRLDDDGAGNVQVGGPFSGSAGGVSGSFNDYLIRTALIYEIDLWRRIQSKCMASRLEYCATREDVENTALLLSGSVTEFWFNALEQRALLDLYKEQIAVNKTNLELVELRFAIGEASALDVYQQRLQLTNTEEQPITASANLQLAYNQLNVLMGQPLNVEFPMTPKQLELELPSFPEVGVPIDLFASRPDLRAAFQLIIAADYEVASAVADMYPRLTLNLAYDFQAAELKNIFKRKIWSIIGDLIYPIIDGSRRAAEVARRRAILCEQLDALYQLFLQALQEVEDAISEEKYQVELLRQIAIELEAAENTVREARSRYVNGLNDYLPVITAQQSLQNLQRRQIAEKVRQLAIRARLYRALGGNVLCREPKTNEFAIEDIWIN